MTEKSHDVSQSSFFKTLLTDTYVQTISLLPTKLPEILTTNYTVCIATNRLD